MKPLVLSTALLALSGCASMGYQSSTLNVDRDKAMMGIGEAHQACKDRKIPKEVCTRVDELAATVKAGNGGSIDLGSLIGLFGAVAPLLGL